MTIFVIDTTLSDALSRKSPLSRTLFVIPGLRRLIPRRAKAIRLASQDISDEEYGRQAREPKEKIMAVCRGLTPHLGASASHESLFEDLLDSLAENPHIPIASLIPPEAWSKTATEVLQLFPFFFLTIISSWSKIYGMYIVPYMAK